MPKWCGGRDKIRSQQNEPSHSLPEGFEDEIFSQNPTGERLQNAVFPPTHVPFPKPTAQNR